nr:immunoglobulin light chain junction region [Macaca mulatta]
DYYCCSYTTSDNWVF